MPHTHIHWLANPVLDILPGIVVHYDQHLMFPGCRDLCLVISPFASREDVQRFFT
jgi:hypothetical protein